MKKKSFPIVPTLYDDVTQSVPWHIIESHNEQAKINHDQSLEALAESGGLGWREMWYVLNDQKRDPKTLILTRTYRDMVLQYIKEFKQVK